MWRHMSKGAVPPVPGSLSEVQAFWYSCPSGYLTPWMLEAGGRGGGIACQ